MTESSTDAPDPCPRNKLHVTVTEASRACPPQVSSLGQGGAKPTWGWVTRPINQLACWRGWVCERGGTLKNLCQKRPEMLFITTYKAFNKARPGSYSAEHNYFSFYRLTGTKTNQNFAV